MMSGLSNRENPLTQDMQQLDGTAYELTSENNGQLVFTSVTAMEAYKPYIFVAGTTGKSFASFSSRSLVEGNPIAATAGNYTFVGTKEATQLVSDDDVVYFGFKASDGSFVKVGTGSGANVPAYRCYLSVAADKAPATAPTAVFQDETTGIAEVRVAQDTPAAIYSLDGRLVSGNGSRVHLPQGVYIQNNRKFIVK